MRKLFSIYEKSYLYLFIYFLSKDSNIHTQIYTHHNINLLIILMRSVSITKVAEEVIPSQMPEEIIIVHEARVTKLTQGMASMAAVISVSLAPVLS